MCLLLDASFPRPPCLLISFAGLFSVYTHWRNIEIMFHVSTLLPYEKVSDYFDHSLDRQRSNGIYNNTVHGTHVHIA